MPCSVAFTPRHENCFPFICAVDSVPTVCVGHSREVLPLHLSFISFAMPCDVHGPVFRIHVPFTMFWAGDLVLGRSDPSVGHEIQSDLAPMIMCIIWMVQRKAHGYIGLILPWPLEETCHGGKCLVHCSDFFSVGIKSEVSLS